VVTGASSGIGAALARRLAQQGYPLLLVARRLAVLQRSAEVLSREFGVTVRVHRCDLGDPAQREALVRELAQLPVEVLCNNAGFPTCGLLQDNDPVRESEEVEVNVVALHALTLAVLPGMLARRSGGILVTGSTAGVQPVPTAATYSASKAFANAFTQAVHAEVAGSGVRVTLLAPGPVLTAFNRAGGVEHIERVRWFGWLTPERVAIAGLDGLARGRRVVVPGPVAKAQAFCGRHLPALMLDTVLRLAILPRLRAGSRQVTLP
jgi:short-subunit dehydrogenase